MDGYTHLYFSLLGKLCSWLIIKIKIIVYRYNKWLPKNLYSKHQNGNILVIPLKKSSYTGRKNKGRMVKDSHKQNLISSMPSRVAAVITAKGSHTKY